MQREIKFRGQRVDTKEWVYGGFSLYRLGNCFITVMGKDHISYIGRHQEVIPETVGQSTGLHDKNGKEIYEGDICIVSLSYFKIKNEKATVIFHNGAFQFQYGCEKFFSKPHDAWDEVDVIGNIYENPELLEVSE